MVQVATEGTACVLSVSQPPPFCSSSYLFVPLVFFLLYHDLEHQWWEVAVHLWPHFWDQNIHKAGSSQILWCFAASLFTVTAFSLIHIHSICLCIVLVAAVEGSCILNHNKYVKVTLFPTHTGWILEQKSGFLSYFSSRLLHHHRPSCYTVAGQLCPVQIWWKAVFLHSYTIDACY